MKAFLCKVLVGGVSLGLASVSFAESATTGEVSCRVKAKEVAAQAYSSCVVEARSAQIEKVHKDYQKQMSELKNRYEKELRKLGSSEVTAKSETPSRQEMTPQSETPARTEVTSAEIPTTPKKTSSKKGLRAPKIVTVHSMSSNDAPATASTGSKPMPTKGIAKTLPTRKEVKNTPPPAQALETTEGGSGITGSTTPAAEIKPQSNRGPLPRSSDENAAAAEAAQNEMTTDGEPSL